MLVEKLDSTQSIIKKGKKKVVEKLDSTRSTSLKKVKKGKGMYSSLWRNP